MFVEFENSVTGVIYIKNKILSTIAFFFSKFGFPLADLDHVRFSSSFEHEFVLQKS